MRFENLPEFEKKRLCEFLVGRRVNLFVGSGVSLDSNGLEEPMFSASQLNERLIEINDLPPKASLQQAYSALSESQISVEITERYTCTSAGTTVQRLAHQPWKRVYSLNVDNCFQSAFKEVVARKEFDPSSLETMNYDDNYRDQTADIRCSIVHLHGFVEKPETPYVFSHTEYAQLMRQPNSWMVTLCQLMKTECFIVAGTTLDEIDVEYYLSQRNQKTYRADAPPSILIEPFPNKLTEILCERHEFCLFEGTPLEFFLELESIEESLKDCWVDNGNDGLGSLELDRAERLRFSSSFFAVPRTPEVSPNPARFLLGSELTWSMLNANIDIPRDVFSTVRSEILDATKGNDVRVMLLLDEPGTGKTAFLKRLAFDFSKSFSDIFWFSGNEFELSPKNIAEIFNKISGDCIVFVDNLADSLSSFTMVLDHLTKTNILFVCSERDYRTPYIENVLTNEDYSQIKDFLGLTRNEISLLMSVHKEHGLSTIQKKEGSVDWFEREIHKRPIAIAVCRIQNNFKQIEDIAIDLASYCTDEEFSAYLMVALARFCYSKGVRRSVLSSTSSAQVIEDLFLEGSSLPLKYSDEDSSFVMPKQPVLADRLLEIAKSPKRNTLPSKSSKILLYSFVELAKCVAARATQKNQGSRTPESQMLGRLMDYDTNVKRFIDEYAEEFFLELKPLCDWNARYWEQLSLLKLDRFFASPDDKFLLEESIQNARSALSRQSHPFSLTTLAKVLFKAMAKSQPSRDEYFEEAWLNIVEANRLEKRWHSRGATLFVVCFTGVLDFLDMGGQLSGEQMETLRDMVSETHALQIKDRKLRDYRNEITEMLA